MSKQNTIGIAAIILPRMELDHLKEWIDYHLQIGVSRLFLFNNGHISVDPAFGAERENGRIWHKKPEANYHLELTDREVDEKIESIIREFGDRVTHISWPTGKQHGLTFTKCQKSAVNGELRRQEKLKDVAWLAHIDVDELLVCTHPLEKILSDLPNNVSAVKLFQKVFLSRWINGEAQSYSRITETFGLVNFNAKLIARVGRVKRWTSPHGVLIRKGYVWKAPPELFRFHHFRGNQHHGTRPPKGYQGVNKYCQLDETQIKLDRSHLIDQK